MTRRQEKVANVIKELSATFFGAEADKTSLITVINCTVSKDLKRATIFITVLPEEKEQPALQFARRRRKDLREYLAKNMKTKFIPAIDVIIDAGEKSRQRIDQLSQEI